MPNAQKSSVNASRGRQDAREDLFSRLENQGFRELAAAHLLAAGVALAPTIDDKQMLAAHVREELSHFETIATVYEELGGSDLLPLVEDRVRELRTPTSWDEMVVAAFVFDLAVYHQLVSYRELSHIVLRRVVESGLANELAHQKAAEAMFIDAFRARTRAEGPEGISEHLAMWLQLALGALDDQEDSAPRDVSDAGGAVEAGGAPANPAPQRSASVRFLGQVARILDQVGLSLPDLATAESLEAPRQGSP